MSFLIDDYVRDEFAKAKLHKRAWRPCQFALRRPFLTLGTLYAGSVTAAFSNLAAKLPDPLTPALAVGGYTLAGAAFGAAIGLIAGSAGALLTSSLRRIMPDASSPAADKIDKFWNEFGWLKIPLATYCFAGAFALIGQDVGMMQVYERQAQAAGPAPTVLAQRASPATLTP